jgi:hypothetical protein
MKRFIFAITLVLTLTAIESAKASEDECLSTAQTIIAKLNCMQTISYTEIPSTILGYRFFDLRVDQFIDHNDPSLGTFKQRVVLLHKNVSEPMVLQTSGYSIFSLGQSAISKMFQTNQIQVEHRFFSDSKPSILDWSKLDIKQAADDFHEIAFRLKKIYPQAWVNTGASKGGMTSIYHRRFYPDDVVGTVADVAPLSFTTSDQRYIDFVNTVGGEEMKECRQKLKTVQTTLLAKAQQFVPLLQGNFTQLGSAAVAFEHSVIEAPFYFWQYGNPSGCADIPANGSPEQMFAYLQTLASINDYTDDAIARFQPYYYQAATQLGNPGNSTAHLEIYRYHDFTIDQYVPKDLQYNYNNLAMHDVSNWVRTDGDQIIFIYGTFDPWTAGEFPVSETGKKIEKYYVARGNHQAKFTNLATEQRQAVIRTLAGWFGKAPVIQKMDLASPTLEDLEFAARKQYKLP